MQPSQRTVNSQSLFNWDQSTLSLESENESWIQQVFRGDGADTPLNLFLNIPVHSPRDLYERELFRTVGLDTTLIKVKAGCFVDLSKSRLWLYDTDENQPRSYNGVMSAQKADEALKRKRFGDHTEPDACIRRFHLHHPTLESIAVLILNAKQSELHILKDFFWNHIRGQMNPASIRFNIGNGGRIFSFVCHLPSFVLRTVDVKDGPLEDSRKTPDKKPWRKCRKLSFLSTDADSNSPSVEILYETQHSFTVYGYNKSVWTSNYLGDTYFYNENPENQDTVEYYTEDVDEVDADPEEPMEKWDPSTIGIVEAHKVSPHPCDYFLMVMYERFKQWYEEWMYTFTIIQNRISNHVEKHRATVVRIPTSQDCARETMECIVRNREWLENTEELLALLTLTLRAIITAWNDFTDDAWVHFPNSYGVQSLHWQIVNKVKELGDILKGFLDLEHQCHQFRKKLELDMGAHSGSFSFLQHYTVTFVQVITPAVASAAIVQAQILSIFPQWALFLLLTGGFSALEWYIEPSSSPVRWLRGKMPNLHSHFGVEDDPQDGARWAVRRPWHLASLSKRSTSGVPVNETCFPARESGFREWGNPYRTYGMQAQTGFQEVPLARPRAVLDRRAAASEQRRDRISLEPPWQ
ncbi:hypothetical protein EDB81DRAFT_899788 [Dactylonectria macrodidyma]|uniref:Uncharacterized protein n=1 Tax=Dactylonectria macrodidyma TaxID=307937 RepID=A0A9P9ERI5_9HYPO|nr:hypothetical protein EDB81DRAFT_899788 [Dactylonectria macrodidyma]